MDAFANELIDLMGGTGKVAAYTRAPSSTVHSWRSGLSGSRLDHLLRIVREERLPIDVEALADKHGVSLPRECADEGATEAGEIAGSEIAA